MKHLFLVATCFLFLPSFVLHYYLGLEVKLLFPMLGCICFFMALYESRGRLDPSIIFLTLLLLFCGVVGTLASGVETQLMMSAVLSVNLFIVWHTWHCFSDLRSMKYLLIYGTILTAGAMIAVFYSLAGGGPVAVISLPFSDSYLYITSFTNSVSPLLIRPAGIFDEPGALAMLLTIIVVLNEIFRVNTRWSAALLFAGLFTGSFALFFIAMFYLITKGHQKQIALIVGILAAVIGLLVLSQTVSDVFDDFFLTRTKIVDGRLAGDNRTGQIETFFDLVNTDITLKGNSSSKSHDDDLLDQSSNPFSIYFNYGIFIWIPYAVLELWLLYCSIYYPKHFRFPAIAMFMILLQRPYLYSLYWSMAIVLVVVSIYRQRQLNSSSVATV
jgi:hypothetical protein